MVAGTAPLGPVSVKLEVFSVSGSIDREKVALTGLSRSTVVAPFAGLELATLSAAGAVAAVLNVHVKGVPSGDPSVALIEESSLAVYVVPSASGEFGVRVASCVPESYATVAGT